jgi:hypothetical protein
MSKIEENPTLTKGLKALYRANYDLGAVMYCPADVLKVPGIGRKTLKALQDHAVSLGVVHPIVTIVQRLLKDEWEAGANNQPGWHHEPNQIVQLTKRLEQFL